MCPCRDVYHGHDAVYLLDEVIQAVGANRKNVEDAVEALGHRLEFRSTVIKQKV